jgi:hypothetical protein
MENRPAMEVIKWNEAQRKFLTLPALKYDKTSMPGSISAAAIFERHAPQKYCQMN